MAPFVLMMLFSSALIVGGMILHMRIRSRTRRRAINRRVVSRRLVKRAPHLHDAIFAKTTTNDTEDDWLLLA